MGKGNVLLPSVERFILLNTAGSSSCDGRPEGQALGSAEPEAVCVCQALSLMVTVMAF